MSAIPRAEINRRYRQRNQERLRVEGRERYRANADTWNAQKRAARQDNLEEARAIDRDRAKRSYHSMTPEGRKERNRIHWQKNREKILAERRNKRYGLLPGQYEAMLENQSGECAICRTPSEQAHGGVLAVDHCHKTSRVRGLLCRDCNLAVAMVEKYQTLIPAMENYVRAAAEADAQIRALQDIVKADRK